MVNEQDFLNELLSRFEKAKTRLISAEQSLDAAQKAYEYWNKVQKAYAVVIAHEEWLESQAPQDDPKFNLQKVGALQP